MAEAIRVEFLTNPKDVLANLEKYFSKEVIFNVFDKTMERIASVLAGKVVKEKLSGQLLKRRTGTLARSITGFTVIRGGLPAMTVGVFQGPALAYAATQELGTVGAGGVLPTIKPKNAKHLAIPVNNALTSAGVSRYNSPRDYLPAGRLFFAPSNTVFGVLIDSKRDEVQYILVDSVDIAPKHYLRDTMIENLPWVADLLTKALEKEFTRVLSNG